MKENTQKLSTFTKNEPHKIRFKIFHDFAVQKSRKVKNFNFKIIKPCFYNSIIFRNNLFH